MTLQEDIRLIVREEIAVAEQWVLAAITAWESEYDFKHGVRSKFYRLGATLHFPDDAKTVKYAIVIEKAPGSNYNAYTPDLPGWVAGPIALKRSGSCRNCIEFHLEGMRQDGDSNTGAEPTTLVDYADTEVPAAWRKLEREQAGRKKEKGELGYVAPNAPRSLKVGNFQAVPGTPFPLSPENDDSNFPAQQIVHQIIQRGAFTPSGGLEITLQSRLR